jgi:hypothetical protein
VNGAGVYTLMRARLRNLNQLRRARHRWREDQS